jgi:hypothetical protein
MSTKQKRKSQTRKRKYLTQKQAWLEIAEAHKMAGLNYCAVVRGQGVVGLCESLYSLWRYSAITYRLYSIMINKIKAYGKRKNKHEGEYFWPLTDAGRLHRVKFCQRMARVAG